MIQIGGVYSTFCQEEGILLQKYRDRNGRCSAILFKSIGVRGRFDSPDSREWIFNQQSSSAAAAHSSASASEDRCWGWWSSQQRGRGSRRRSPSKSRKSKSRSRARDWEKNPCTAFDEPGGDARNPRDVYLSVLGEGFLEGGGRLVRDLVGEGFLDLEGS